MMILVMMPTLSCVLWITQGARHALSESHVRSVADIGQAMAATLAGRMDADLSADPGREIQALNLDPRLAFIEVTDHRGVVQYRHSIDAPAWDAYEQWQQEAGPGGINEMGRPLFFDDQSDLVIWQLPIIDAPRSTAPAPGISAPASGTIPTSDAPDTSGAGHDSRTIRGVLILAMRDRHMDGALAYLQGTQLAGACFVCLVMLPLVLWSVRRWTGPLRQLVKATHHLGAGMAPPPIQATTRDEIGQLTRAFNQMARRLYAMRLRLQRANEALERKVVQRTGQLENTRRRLESEIRDKNEFLRAISHDLGAPLRNIGGMASMLLSKHREELADDVLIKLERISENVKAQSELIADLLELSRLRARPGKRQRIATNELLEQLRKHLEYDLERQGITLDVQPNLPTLLAERTRLRQVFQNLLDNAIKYMGQADPRRISISFHAEPQTFHFLVADTGRGIAVQDQRRIFAVFSRGRHSGSHDVPGRGVGLAGVKTIVECYGGRVWVDSELGRGSTFHFTLDRAQVDPDHRDDRKAPGDRGDRGVVTDDDRAETDALAGIASTSD